MPTGNGDFKLIRASRLIDGKGGQPLERGALLIEGDVIRAVGTEEAVVPPEGATVQEFDYEGKTALPGLVDCHVHLIGIGDGRKGDELTQLPDEVLTVQAARNARTHLYSGVTTVRDCGAKNRTTFMLRKAMEMGITPGPRLVLAGRPMAIVGGHLSYFGIGATGVDECRAAVRQLVKEGADFIKITATGGSTRTSYPLMPSFNVDELRAICDEAHKFGLHAAAHCASTQGVVNSLDAGVDTLIHCYYREPDGTYEYRPELSDRIAAEGVWVNPTLHQPRLSMRVLEEKQASGTLTEAEQAELEEVKPKFDIRLDHVSRMREQGVKLVCGSDSAWSYYEMGDFQGEIGTHVEIGMTPMEAIVSATSDSARSCAVDDQVGTLEVGKRADVLVVDGDPSRDHNDLNNVEDVFLGCDRIDRHDYI